MPGESKAMSQVAFVVDICAEPQGSIKSFILEGQVDVRNPCDANGKPNWVRKPRCILTSDNPDLKAYRSAVGIAAHNAMVRQHLPDPMAVKHVGVAIELMFTFLKPPSAKKSRTQMVVRPDVDKLARACLDACKGILYVDDSQVVEIVARKQYGDRESVAIRAHILESDVFATPMALPLVQDF